MKHSQCAASPWSALVCAMCCGPLFIGLRTTDYEEDEAIYFRTIFEHLDKLGAAWLVCLGLLLAVVRGTRDRWVAGVTLVSWAVLPLVLMSAGTSKLHHYAYPFLPPLALAGGYAAAWILKLSQPWAAALVRATRLRESPSGRTLRHALLLLAAVAMLVAVATLVLGRLHLRIGDVTVFRNSNVHRPLLVAVVLGAIAGRPGLPLMLLIIAPPLLAYRGTIDRLTIERHPLRTVRDCLVTVNDGLLADGKGSRGVYVVMPERWLFHSHFYYLR